MAYNFYIPSVYSSAQVALAGTQIWWTTEVNLSFARLEEGYENALKDYYKKQVCPFYKHRYTPFIFILITRIFSL